MAKTAVVVDHKLVRDLWRELFSPSQEFMQDGKALRSLDIVLNS